MSPRVTYKSRVAEGAEWLDSVLPEWWNHNEEHLVDMKTLDLCDGRLCMLGQLEGPLLEALGKSSPYPDRGFATVLDAIRQGWHWAVARGFAENPRDSHTAGARYTSLTRAWKMEIRRRRKEAGVKP